MVLYAGICIFRYFCALERSLIHISRYFSYKTRNTGRPKYEILNTRLYRNRFDPGLIMVYEGSSLIVSYANFYSISSEFINIEYIIYYWYKLCVTYSVRVYPHQGAILNQLRFFQFTRPIKCKVLVVGQGKITNFLLQVTISPVSIISSMDHHHHLSDHEHHPHYHHVHDSSHEGSSSGKLKTVGKNGYCKNLI